MCDDKIKDHWREEKLKGPSRKIEVTYSAGKYFVWNADDVITLRSKHRICSSAIGSLPRKPWQNVSFSLPLILLPEEVFQCYSKGIVRIVSCADQDYYAKRKESFVKMDFKHKRGVIEEEQMKIFKIEKLEKKELYYNRKKKTENYKESRVPDSSTSSTEEDHTSNNRDEPNRTDSSLSSAEINIPSDKDDNTKNHPINISGKSPTSLPTDKDSTRKIISDMQLTDHDLSYYKQSVRVHIPTSTMYRDITTTLSSFNYPSTPRESVLCNVYTDLWEKGYYITSGEKFGGDFLAYPGDPLRFHSHFVVVVMDKDKMLQPRQMIYYGRLGASVKKTVLLASFNEEKKCVDYISLQWDDRT